jgi:hypothetical protein
VDIKAIKLQGVWDLFHLCLSLEEYLQKIDEIFLRSDKSSELVVKYQPIAAVMMIKVKSLEKKISELIESIKIESDTSEPSPLVTAALYAGYAVELSALSTEVEQFISDIDKYL